VVLHGCASFKVLETKRTSTTKVGRSARTLHSLCKTLTTIFLARYTKLQNQAKTSNQGRQGTEKPTFFLSLLHRLGFGFFFRFRFLSYFFFYRFFRGGRQGTEKPTFFVIASSSFGFWFLFSIPFLFSLPFLLHLSASQKGPFRARLPTLLNQGAQTLCTRNTVMFFFRLARLRTLSPHDSGGSFFESRLSFS
jgi:hypothetical protein